MIGSPRERLVSIDVLRGLAVAGMILVNHPGDVDHVYPWLSHAEWHGFGPADQVFPLFLFVVGASVSLSLGGLRVGEGPAPSWVWRKVLKRTLLLLVFGLVLNVVHALPYFDLLETRLPGVLQRIALCFLAVATLVLTTSARAQAVVAVSLLVAYTAILLAAPVPGWGPGVLDQPEGSLVAYVDRWIFGDRLWMKSWDPEGLLSTLPAIATTLSGALVARWLARPHSPAAKRRGLAIAAGTALVTGMAMRAIVPINKNLWSPSFVLVSSGISIVLLGVCVEIADLRRWADSVRPFLFLGANAIAAYLGSELLDQVLALVPHADPARSIRGWIFGHAFASWASPRGASCLYAVIYLLLWVEITRRLHRRGLFFKI